MKSEVRGGPRRSNPRTLRVPCLITVSSPTRFPQAVFSRLSGHGAAWSTLPVASLPEAPRRRYASVVAVVAFAEALGHRHLVAGG